RREASLGVNFSSLGAVPSQSAALRLTASTTDEPPIGNDITFAVWSTLPASLSGHVAGAFGWKGGVKAIPHPPVVPGGPFSSLSCSRLYGMSDPTNVSVRQLVAFCPAPDPVAPADSAAA